MRVKVIMLMMKITPHMLNFRMMFKMFSNLITERFKFVIMTRVVTEPLIMPIMTMEIKITIPVIGFSEFVS